jgi:hypothetical protein
MDKENGMENANEELLMIEYHPIQRQENLELMNEILLLEYVPMSKEENGMENANEELLMIEYHPLQRRKDPELMNEILVLEYVPMNKEENGMENANEQLLMIEYHQMHNKDVESDKNYEILLLEYHPKKEESKKESSFLDRIAKLQKDIEISRAVLRELLENCKKHSSQHENLNANSEEIENRNVPFKDEVAVDEHEFHSSEHIEIEEAASQSEILNESQIEIEELPVENSVVEIEGQILARDQRFDSRKIQDIAEFVFNESESEVDAYSEEKRMAKDQAEFPLHEIAQDIEAIEINAQTIELSSEIKEHLEIISNESKYDVEQFPEEEERKKVIEAAKLVEGKIDAYTIQEQVPNLAQTTAYSTHKIKGNAGDVFEEISHDEKKFKQFPKQNNI